MISRYDQKAESMQMSAYKFLLPDLNCYQIIRNKKIQFHYFSEVLAQKKLQIVIKYTDTNYHPVHATLAFSEKYRTIITYMITVHQHVVQFH
jgi:hypothetical protein